VERIEHQTKTSAAVKATMPELVIQNGHLDYVHSVTYSPDGKTIASASGDNTVKLWDASTGELRYTLEGHSGPIQSIVYSPDGKSIAWYSESFPEAISDEISVKVWNPTTGKLLQSLRGHVESISSIAYSPDGKSIASGSIDKTVKLWRLATGERELFRKTLERCYW
jgi:WD40 repeat protein